MNTNAIRYATPGTPVRFSTYGETGLRVGIVNGFSVEADGRTVGWLRLDNGNVVSRPIGRIEVG